MLNIKRNSGVIVFYVLIIIGTLILINDTEKYEQQSNIIVKR